MTPRTEGTDRAFVLGFDGVPWNLVEEWATDGRLPNFERVLREGAGGPLTSTVPSTTALAWPSIATGVWPDKHGIYCFRSVTSAYAHRMNTSRDLRHSTLWEVVSPSVVGNVPMTYPATEIDGAMVTGMMTPERDEGFTHPPALAAEIDEAIPDYEISLKWEQYHGHEEAFLDALDDLVAARRELMDLLVEREDWRLCFFVYTAPDRLQHLVWKESVLLEHYQTLDEILGDALAIADREDATLYVVSDHGFGPVERLVYVNRLLEEEGYLVRRGDIARGLLGRLGIDKDRVLALLERVGIDDRTLVNYLPRSILDAAAERVPGNHQLYDIAYEDTTAFAHGPGNVYVNDTERFENGTVHPSEIPAIRAELIDLFESAVDSETGDNPLQVRDDGRYPDDGPDLVVWAKPGYAERTILSDQVFAPAESVAGHHEVDGIFCAWGPSIRAETTVGDASVVDVAPTVLHGLGQPVPEQSDGRVLEEIFADDSPPATRSVRATRYQSRAGGDSADRDFETVEDRLRGLGYLQ